MTQAQKERLLLQKAMQGDTAAFGEIVNRYQYLVYALAVQIVRDPAAAQDIAQETFISAFKALKGLHSEDAFPSWLRTITRNSALAWLKEGRRIVPLEEEGMIQSSFDPCSIEAEAEQKEHEAFRAEIRQILSSLSDTLRFPILLCYLNEIPTAEAARFLGIKEGTLRKRLHDGKKKLQERIVKMAERTLQEYRLPPGFAKRCICGCRRAQLETEGTSTIGKEVIRMAKKENCGCGCMGIPAGKKEKPKPSKDNPKEKKT